MASGPAAQGPRQMGEAALPPPGEGGPRAGRSLGSGRGTFLVDPGLMQDSAEQTFHRSSCAFLRTYLRTQSF